MEVDKTITPGEFILFCNRLGLSVQLRNPDTSNKVGPTYEVRVIKKDRFGSDLSYNVMVARFTVGGTFVSCE